ncbi:hypothetical protein D3H35_25435 [Cohnella faecalis]|uniref:Uncharacterized protein n=1 Tax=Cohnella faecalis TaxID=2315694 RepID=A0A398CCJ6_9BACL|nr:hypothetical protein D3H35_25435 [Cohnella faecalis]
MACEERAFIVKRHPFILRMPFLLAAIVLPRSWFEQNSLVFLPLSAIPEDFRFPIYKKLLMKS